MQYHVPVLCSQSLDVLDAKRSGIFVDCTLGGGGHFKELLHSVGPGSMVIGLDRDPESMKHNAALVAPDGIRMVLVNSPFSKLDTVLETLGIGPVDGIFADLGVSSRQIDAAHRGFAYMQSAPLDMRMDSAQEETAHTIIARARVEDLAQILSEYGEVLNPTRMAQAIIAANGNSPLLTSDDLKNCLYAEYGRNLPVKVLAKVFQALRIAVNSELAELKTLLSISEKVLARRGRIAIISYHSLEDRMVKQFMASRESPCMCPKSIPQCVCGRSPVFAKITRKAIQATDAEIAANPRSRSARLRCAEKIGEPWVEAQV